MVAGSSPAAGRCEILRLRRLPDAFAGFSYPSRRRAPPIGPTTEVEAFRGDAHDRTPKIHHCHREYGFPDVQLHIKVRSFHSRPGMTTLLTPFRALSVICPSCQLVAAASACCLTPKHLTVCNVPPHRGAFRDRHERRARDAVDAGCATDEGADRGRRSRVVLMPRRWHQVGENAYASRRRR
jgi:hypothetical protein